MKWNKIGKVWNSADRLLNDFIALLSSKILRLLLSILIKEDFFFLVGGGGGRREESEGWDKAIWRIVRTSVKILATPLWRLIGVTSCGYIGFVFKHIYLFIFISTYRQDYGNVQWKAFLQNSY